jgi:hypothetical protein
MRAMSRVRDFGRDAAEYFGIGERSDDDDRDDDAEPWFIHGSGIVVVLSLAYVLRRVHGFDDDSLGFLALLAIVVVLACLWGLASREVRRRRPSA